MNIHINKSQFEELKKGTLLTIKMGSSMYGCEIDTSDVDYIHIFAHNSHWENSFIWTHHNFQYKEDKVDHIFVSLKDFVRNLIKGDSTINYECLFSKEMEKSKELSFLFDFRNYFNNYSLVRAYLGLVKRDLKIFSQGYDSKKLYHSVRGLASAQMALNNNYSNNLSKNPELFKKIMNIRKNVYSKLKMIEIMKQTSSECAELRDKVTKDFQDKKMNRLMNVDKMKELDEIIIRVCDSNWYKSKMNHNFRADEVYDIIENDISYT